MGEGSGRLPEADAYIHMQVGPRESTPSHGRPADARASGYGRRALGRAGERGRRRNGLRDLYPTINIDVCAPQIKCIKSNMFDQCSQSLVDLFLI